MLEQDAAEDASGYWNGVVETSRTPSPTPRPAKRAKQTWGSRATSATLAHEELGPATFASELIDTTWSEAGDDALGLGLREYSMPSILECAAEPGDTLPSSGSIGAVRRRMKMRTGCIPCLAKGKPCDPRDPNCQLVMSDEWRLNYPNREGEEDELLGYTTPESMSLSAYRPDTKWRRNWRERHSLNFFVNFSAPQLAGFFDSTFWQRMVIQWSYHEPAILHAITAIGALHEAIMQRAFADEKRKAQAMEFALSQCNRAIASLTKSGSTRGNTAGSRLALTTCVLFTCFEAMQGRCDSAVSYALQGRRLLHAMSGSNATSMTSAEQDALDQIRPLVERLEVQATALLDKRKRPETDTLDQTASLPLIEYLFSLDDAHSALHMALNSVMRFMQGFLPTAPMEQKAFAMANKYLRYGPWFQQWETAFTEYLADNRGHMSNLDIKRAMVLKANHLVGTMLASVDQSAGPVAYDAYEAEFKAIVDLSREVLASFSSPPLPTLSGRKTGTPYLSFSLWVTDPLWMAISRCRNPSIRQAAFTLLSQNPRQEGIWHAGPTLADSRYMRRVEAGPTSGLTKAVKGVEPPDKHANDSDADDGDEVPGQGRKAQPVGNSKVRGEWVDLGAQVSQGT
ncbi:hypothetical protein LTR36_003688 [Oleoguttula mirabilis]|uniref:Zn(2)-C6 fungal-type domain-containing protein n=1 Tax=Oleoguttula mirabilis TaxID=1507867 RepID=A0AAV9JJI2_9PEZI|nr:hypothetical protein LTR36_003688 [Oleoguttula mirabilis]